jgi:hypothetical protein
MGQAVVQERFAAAVTETRDVTFWPGRGLVL